MLKQHKNAFLDVIKLSGLDPANFTAEMRHVSSVESSVETFLRLSRSTEDEKVFVIEIKNSPLRFAIRVEPGDFYKFKCKGAKFKPGFPMSGWWWRDPHPIEYALKQFRTWLDRVAKKYIEDNDLPDYWSQIEMYKSFVSGSATPPKDDKEFTEQEKEEVRNSVDRFRALIAETFNPTPEQSVFINERLDYLSRATDRLNRFDWQGLAISVVVSIAVNLSADTERGRVLFNLFKQAFQSTIKLLQ
jgi:hypothetical protein